ncbi:hypothetical protein KPH14_010772 [Odynerus spinipes]|uniref:HAT C-terminal dimerisation domain-containing protein n=1 Tax=Odynerus spinipes TaxID=1348599 RepID=A0AAD9VNB6_9HYME|nr:hypothetical protein KPH14_010772 [Odynerus spinipes]
MKYIGTQSNTTAASYQVSKNISQHVKPFNEGEFLKDAWLQCAPYLFEDFENKEKIIQRIKDMPIARNTVKENILGMAENVNSQQKIHIKSCDFISICLDESTDVTGSARLAIFVRYFVQNNIKELISLSTLTTTTTKGLDICNAVIDALAKREICPSKTVSVTTDGARTLTGRENGFIHLFTKRIGHTILDFYCIIHQQALCAKTGLKMFDDILSFVTKLVNFISARALNKRKFQELLNEVNSSYNSLLLYNNVRWLSRGNVLQRFVDCLEEIRLFLNNENIIDQYNQLLDVEWLAKLYFFTDLCSHLNELNIKLQGVNKTDFPARFTQFKEFEETLKFILYPDTIPFEKLNLKVLEWLSFNELEMELVEFQSSTIWNQKFVDLRNDLEIIESNRLLDKINKIAENEILTTWNSIPDTFNCLKTLAKAILSIFSSTWACKSLFSELNFIQNKYRNRMTNESSSACVLLKLTKYELDIKSLSSCVQQQKSH